MNPLFRPSHTQTITFLSLPLLLNSLKAACLALAADCRQGGTFGRLGHVLRDFLEENLPKDAHELARGKVHVAVTPLAAAEVAAVAPTRQARVSSEKLLSSLAEQASLLSKNSNPFALSPRALLVSDFSSREDLIEALLSSCHIPFWMTGRPTPRFRGGRAVDGGLLNFLPLPPPPAERGARGGKDSGENEDGDDDLDCYHTVGVCCFPSASTIGARLGPGRLIAPDVFEPVSALEEAAGGAGAFSRRSSVGPSRRPRRRTCWLSLPWGTPTRGPGRASNSEPAGTTTREQRSKEKGTRVAAAAAAAKSEMENKGKEKVFLFIVLVSVTHAFY